ncbi:MAG: restriction endonuclease subunit S, partial [Victivallales bacterium]|nr:restriction endonuclease subunit S [Victivallales bacterium]
MNTIDKLIAELCPEGVEFKELGEVCRIEDNKRKPVKSSLREAGNIPYYGANNIQDHVKGFTHEGEYVLVAEDGSASLEN